MVFLQNILFKQTRSNVRVRQISKSLKFIIILMNFFLSETQTIPRHIENLRESKYHAIKLLKTPKILALGWTWR